MKLSALSEDNFLKSLKKNVGGKSYFSRPRLHAIQNYGSGNRGLDAGSRASGFNFMTTGVPHKARHRRYFSITPPNTM